MLRQHENDLLYFFLKKLKKLNKGFSSEEVCFTLPV